MNLFIKLVYDRLYCVDAVLVHLVAELVRSKIVNSVLDKALNIGVMESMASLVPRLEIDQLARALVVASAASEHMSVLKPTAQQQLVGLRNIERLCVKLFIINKEVIGNTCKDGVSGVHVPDDLPLVSSPGQITCRAENTLEGLGVMRGMKRKEAHAVIYYSLENLFNKLVLHLAVSQVSPPDKNVGIIENLICKTLLGIVKRNIIPPVS